MHKLLKRQMARASAPDGELDLALLFSLIDAAYSEADLERERNDRAMLLTCEEMDTLNEELRELAHHDMLTGLPNRLSFGKSAAEAIRRARQGESLAVLLVDLDRFKAINDALGHAMGDALLRDVATRLLGAIRSGDTVARIGGDEFAILQVGRERLDSAEKLARRLVDSLSAPYHIAGCTLTVGACVGVALAVLPNIGDVDQLMLDADRALYRAKNEGRCTWRVHVSELAESQELAIQGAAGGIPFRLEAAESPVVA